MPIASLPDIIAPKSVGRPADRQDLIIQELRQMIVRGELGPGHRLPTRPEIEERYGAGTSTVQRALDKLRQDGFISSNGRNGTSVVPHPPHLTRYALVFAEQPTIRGWVRYWTALAKEAEIIERTTDLSMPIYYGVDGHSDSPDYRRLMDDARNQRLAGVIFPERNHLMERTPLWSVPDLPLVTAGHDIVLDAPSFWDRACEYMAARGRQRVAIVSRGESEAATVTIAAAIDRHGLETRPYWWQAPTTVHASSVRNAVHLLLSAPAATRPDALIIADDNMLEAASSGLLAAELRVPEDVDVIAHCNFPWPTSSAIPVQRLGYHSGQLLRACIGLIDAKRRGERPGEGEPAVRAIFENEIPQFGALPAPERST